jgi:hypothetical protein
MKTERGFVSIGIEISHVDEELQELYFDQFLQLKKILIACVGEEWDWNLLVTNEFGHPVSRIEKVLKESDVMNEEYWPEIISFLKPRIIGLDDFWDRVKPGFENF